MAVEGRFQQAVGKRSTPASVWALIGIAVAGIWVGVVLAGIFAPDFVTGTQHDHMPLAWFDWIWGLVATSVVVIAAIKGIQAGVVSLAPWVVLAVGVTVVWIGVALVSAFAPVMVTGTDPTRIPLTAMGVPILGCFLTGFIAALVRTVFEPNRA